MFFALFIRSQKFILKSFIFFLVFAARARTGQGFGANQTPFSFVEALGAGADEGVPFRRREAEVKTFRRDFF